MISNSQKRRQRKSKQNKFKTKRIGHKSYIIVIYRTWSIIEHYKKLRDIVVSGYLRQIISSCSHLPFEIETLCRMYCNEKSVVIHHLDELTPNIHGTLTFGETFNDLYHYEKMIFCRRIIRPNKLPIHYLRVYPANSRCTERETLSQQIYFIEYILYKHYNTLTKLDLSQMYMNDRHVLYLCNAIENISKYRTQKKIGDAKKKLNDRKHQQTPKYLGSKKVQREVEKQFERMKKAEVANLGKIKATMKLEDVNLLMNAVSDKYFDLLLRTIKRYCPRIKRLSLSSNNISNKSLASVMKY
eukprot:925842_1